MAARNRTLLALIALLVLAPALAAVLISALLLFGVDPHLVFLPGHGLRGWLERAGVHASNRAGVLTTVIFWWALIVLVWVALRSLRRRE